MSGAARRKARGGGLWAVLLAGWLSSALAVETPRLDPDLQLHSALQTLRAGDFGTASQQLQALVEAQPNFRLAQLLYGEVLAARSGKPMAEVLGPGDGAQLQDLLDELRARSSPDGSHAAPGLLPNAVLELADSIRYAIVVDLVRSRLYLLQNGRQGPQIVRSFYAAIARKGFGKQSSGDLRTPVGVYEITRWMPGAQLPDLYGAGAFPLNYPNSWDRSLGKSGYGIWLHGVPRDTYVRAPRSSEGCVTLANRDLLALAALIKDERAPVVLADHLEWWSQARRAREREVLDAAIERWRRAGDAGEVHEYLSFYADDFRSDQGLGKRAFAEQVRHVKTGGRRMDWAAGNLSLYAYPGERDLVLARFALQSGRGKSRTLVQKDQYWRRQPDGHWKIVREDDH